MRLALADVTTLEASSSLPALVLDVTGGALRCVFANPALERTVGAAPGELEGPGWLSRVRPAARAEMKARFRPPPQGGFCFEMPLSDGSRRDRWTRVMADPFEAADEPARSAPYFLLRLVDVSDLRDAQAGLRNRRELLALADAEMAVSHWMVFADSGQVLWSAGVHAIHGTDPATYRPALEQALDAYHPDDRDRVASHIQASLGQGEPFDFEARLVRTDGTVRTVHSVGTPVAPRPGGPDIIGIFRDITEERAMLARLQASEERYALALGASRDGIWDWSSSSDELYWSPRLREMLGLDEDSPVRGLGAFVERIHPDEVDAARAALEAHLDHATPFDIDLRLRREDGDYPWFRAQGTALRDEDGTPRRMVGVLADISAERAREADLRRTTRALEQKTAELESSNAELARFAAVASHDLKEPLRKIRTFADLVRLREEDLSPTGREDLERIARSAARLQTMVNGILEMAQAPWTQRRVACRLDEALDRALELLAAQAEAAEARIERSGRLPVVQGDPGQLQRLFQNLLDNALRYRHPDRECVIAIRSRADGEGCTIEILDNGIGFEPRYAERIFEMFERLHPQHVYGGTGMGLALCRRIVESLGGRLTAEGVPGQGAVFSVWLPARPVRTTERSP